MILCTPKMNKKMNKIAKGAAAGSSFSNFNDSDVKNLLSY
jgi:hypothetical protein